MKKTRFIAANAALFIALGAMSGGIADAQTRPVTGNSRDLSAVQMDKNRELSLKVTKAKGNPYDNIPGKLPEGRLGGVTFTLSRATDIDVTTEAGLKDARRARTEEEFAKLKRVTVAKKTTDDNGDVLFTGLKPGLYCLEEKAPDSSHNYHVSSPQWVVLPFGSATGDSFVYENVMVVKPAPTTTPSTPPTRPSTPPTKPSTPGNPPTTPSTPGNPPSTPSTTPSEPGKNPPPSTPGQPPQNPDNPKSPGKPGGLASTGANVLFAIIAGLILIGLGLFMTRRKAQ